MLGENPFLWCWPRRAPGDGLSYEIAMGDGEWTSLPPGRLDGGHSWGDPEP